MREVAHRQNALAVDGEAFDDAAIAEPFGRAGLHGTTVAAQESEEIRETPRADGCLDEDAGGIRKAVSVEVADGALWQEREAAAALGGILPTPVGERDFAPLDTCALAEVVDETFEAGGGQPWFALRSSPLKRSASASMLRTAEL